MSQLPSRFTCATLLMKLYLLNKGLFTSSPSNRNYAWKLQSESDCLNISCKYKFEQFLSLHFSEDNNIQILRIKLLN